MESLYSRELDPPWVPLSTRPGDHPLPSPGAAGRVSGEPEPEGPRTGDRWGPGGVKAEWEHVGVCRAIWAALRPAWPPLPVVDTVQLHQDAYVPGTPSRCLSWAPAAAAPWGHPCSSPGSWGLWLLKSLGQHLLGPPGWPSAGDWWLFQHSFPSRSFPSGHLIWTS